MDADKDPYREPAPAVNYGHVVCYFDYSSDGICPICGASGAKKVYKLYLRNSKFEHFDRTCVECGAEYIETVPDRCRQAKRTTI